MNVANITEQTAVNRCIDEVDIIYRLMASTTIMTLINVTSSYGNTYKTSLICLIKVFDKDVMFLNNRVRMLIDLFVYVIFVIYYVTRTLTHSNK